MRCVAWCGPHGARGIGDLAVKPLERNHAAIVVAAGASAGAGGHHDGGVVAFERLHGEVSDATGTVGTTPRHAPHARTLSK